jgi:hypothetical protein
MGVDADRKKVAKLINQMDRSITNGMTQTQVVELLGRPATWYTNGNTIGADFQLVPLRAIFYGTITSGFTITFTNGAVFQKFPIVTGSQ